MKMHVLPGEAQHKEFTEAGIEGEVIVCNEAFISGPIDTSDIDLFWDERANFIFTEYGEDPIEYHEKVADELARLDDVTADADVTLWFEYELFCSVNMWFCLDRLKVSGTSVYRAAPKNLSPENIWDGFAGHDAAMLRDCFDARIQFSEEDIAVGSRLWQAYGKRDHETLRELSEYRSPCFPFLKEVCLAAVEIDTRPLEVVADIKAEGITEFDKVFTEFRRRAGVYGFGDVQVEQIMKNLV